MLFSSGKHGSQTTDPYPVVNPLVGKRFSYPKTKRALMSCERVEGRPEFDRPLTNPANPILADYRAADGHWPIEGYVRSLRPANSWQWESIATLDEIDHAFRVLKRLASLIKAGA